MAHAAFVKQRKDESSKLLLVIGGQKARVRNNRTKAAIFVFAALALALVLDGVLTYLGLARFGIAMEANGFVQKLCEIIGIIPGLIVAKGFALMCLGIIYHYGKKYLWVTFLVGGLTLVHVGFALVPWTIILYS